MVNDDTNAVMRFQQCAFDVNWDKRHSAVSQEASETIALLMKRI